MKNLLKFKSNIDKDVKFSFNVFNPLWDGVIFITSILVAPLIFSVISKIVLTFAFDSSSANWESVKAFSQVILISLQIVSAAIGSYILFRRDRELFTSTNIFGIFLFIIIPVLLSIILGSIISLIALRGIDTQSNTYKIFNGFWSIWSQLVAEVFIIFFLFKKVVSLKERIIETFKRDWKNLIIIVVCAGIITIGVSIGFSFISTNKSENQSALEELLNNDSKIVTILYAISLFIFTILVAPLAEELAFRDSVFTGSGNKYLGVVVSTILFALIHVYSTNDLENIWLYLVPSLIFSCIFIYTEGNVTYTWLIHLLSNLVTFILMMVQK